VSSIRATAAWLPHLEFIRDPNFSILAFVAVRLDGAPEDKVRLRLEVLNVLANRPDGRATLDEVKWEAGAIAPSESQAEQLKRFPEIGEIDIFTSGLVFRDSGFLQITEAGRSLLHSLESANAPAFSAASPGPQMVDDLIAATGPDRSRGVAEDVSATGMPVKEQNDASGPPDAVHRDHPVVVPLPGFRSTLQDSDRRSWPAGLFAALTAKTRSVAGAWRGHFERDTSSPIAARAGGSTGAATLAFISFVALMACAIAVIALVQTKSLKTETATLDRELGPLRERLAKLERAEKTRLATEQQEAGQSKPAADKDKPGVVQRTDQVVLNLSRDEIQLVREYIKPAPATGTQAPAINVGDPVSGGTIPLPSSLTDKVPKLLGARFAIRNGSIIIVKRDSQKADAVLAPN
jgi:hypothetical protein